MDENYISDLFFTRVPVLNYSKALAEFEDIIERKVTDRFTCKNFFEQCALRDFAVTLRDIFAWSYKRCSSLPIIANTASDYIVKRSVLYSPDVIVSIPGEVTNEYYCNKILGIGALEEFVAKYHRLIRNDVLSFTAENFHTIDSYGTSEDDKFIIDLSSCAVVADHWINELRRKSLETIHLKVMLPDVSSISIRRLSELMANEEIFANYHAALNTLNVRNGLKNPETKLRDLILEIDDKTRDLNARFKVLSRQKTWQVARGITGISLTGFSYFLPLDIGTTIRTIIGTLSAVTLADSAVTILQRHAELKDNPYYFSYLVNSTGAE